MVADPDEEFVQEVDGMDKRIGGIRHVVLTNGDESLFREAFAPLRGTEPTEGCPLGEPLLQRRAKIGVRLPEAKGPLTGLLQRQALLQSGADQISLVLQPFIPN